VRVGAEVDDVRKRWAVIAVVFVLIAGVGSAEAIRIGDIARLKGQRVNKLVGFGLVVGLKGTGDGGKFMPSIRPLASLLKRFNNPVFSMEELEDAKNVAVVLVEATLPEHGVREGDQVDVHLSSFGAAKSLRGGRLLVTPLQGPSPRMQDILALAGGAVVIPDTEVPTVGLVRNGATMERNILHTYVVRGAELAHRHPGLAADGHYVTLVLDDAHANFAMAANIAMRINEKHGRPGSDLAIAVDPKNVIVRIPRYEMSNVASFVGAVESTDLLHDDVTEATEARVRINRKTGTIVITGDVEVSPAVITQRGLTITVTGGQGQAVAPGQAGQQGEWVALNPRDLGSVEQKQMLSDLVQALNQMKVPISDRIAIIEELHKTGKLHGRLTVDE